MALTKEVIRDIERVEIERSRDIWANNENRRREQEAKDKKRTFNEEDKTTVEQRVPLPKFRSGDTVRVHAKVVEGDKERIQVFEGVVIAMNHESARACFTVRKLSHGVGVERTFLLQFAPSGKNRSGALRQSAPRQTLLSARQNRQGDPYQGRPQRHTLNSREQGTGNREQDNTLACRQFVPSHYRAGIILFPVPCSLFPLKEVDRMNPLLLAQATAPGSDTGATEFLANLSIDKVALIALALTVVRLLMLNPLKASLGNPQTSSAARSIAEVLESLIIALVLVFLIIRPFFCAGFLHSFGVYGTDFAGSRCGRSFPNAARRYGTRSHFRQQTGVSVGRTAAWRYYRVPCPENRGHGVGA